MSKTEDDWPALRQWARDYVDRHQLCFGAFLEHHCRLPGVQAWNPDTYRGYAAWLSDPRRPPSVKPNTLGRLFRQTLRQMRAAESPPPPPMTMGDAVQHFWRECGDRFASDGIVHTEFQAENQTLVLRVWEGYDQDQLGKRVVDALSASQHSAWFDGLNVLMIEQSFFA
jgi:hypothetical protein